MYRSQGRAEVHIVQESLRFDLEEAEWEDVQIVLGHTDLTTHVAVDLEEELKK